MTDTTHDKTDPAKAPVKPGDKAVATPPAPADQHAAGALEALQKDATHPAIAGKATEAGKATDSAVKPAKSESESLSDKLHDDLGWAYKKAASVVSNVAADVMGTPKDAAAAPKDAGAAAAPKDAKAAAPKDATGTAPKDTAAPNAAAKPVDGSPAPAAAAAPSDSGLLSYFSDATKSVYSTLSNAAEGAEKTLESTFGTGTAPKDTTGNTPKDVPAPGAAAAPKPAAPNAAAKPVDGAPAPAPTDASSVSGMLSSLSDATKSIYSQLTTAAETAETTFESTFGKGAQAMQNFAETAEKVSDVSKINFNPFNSAKDTQAIASDKNAAESAAKAAGISWMVPGDTKPGGNTSIVAKDGHVDASGKNVDGVAVTAEVTAEKSTVTGGAVTAMKTKQGIETTDHTDYKVLSNTGDVETVENLKTHETTEFNSKTHEATVRNPNTGTVTVFKANGDVVTQFSSGKEVHQVADALTAGQGAVAKPDSAGPVTTKYYDDPSGNMKAIQSDGLVYQYDAKTHNLEVGKDGKWVDRNLTTGKISYYSEDPTTHAMTEVPAGSLPAGVAVTSDGQIAVNGAKVSDTTGQTIKLGTDGTAYDTKAKKLTAAVVAGAVTVESTPAGTVLTGPGQLVVKAPAAGAGGDASIASGGSPATTYNAKTGMNLAAPDGASIAIKPNGDIQLHSANGQNTGIDATGVHAMDKQGHLLFNMNNQGDVGMYDGTMLNHDGEVTNAARDIDMRAYIPTPVDTSSSDGSDDSSQSSNGNGDGSNNGYNDGDGDGKGSGYANADGTNPDGSVDATNLAAVNDDSVSYATFDKLENKVESFVDRLKAKWNFGKDSAEAKEGALAGRADNTELSKWRTDVKDGNLAALPTDWKVKGIVQALTPELGAVEKGLKDAQQPGPGSLGDVASLENFKDKLDALSLKFGIDTGAFSSKLSAMEQTIENKVAATNMLEERGLTPTAERLKRLQDSGNNPNAVLANAFAGDERASA
jgi:hypothetical protein